MRQIQPMLSFAVCLWVFAPKTLQFPTFVSAQTVVKVEHGSNLPKNDEQFVLLMANFSNFPLSFHNYVRTSPGGHFIGKVIEKVSTLSLDCSYVVGFYFFIS